MGKVLKTDGRWDVEETGGFVILPPGRQAEEDSLAGKGWKSKQVDTMTPEEDVWWIMLPPPEASLE